MEFVQVAMTIDFNSKIENEPRYRVVSPGEFVVRPWKNGLGQTLELLRVDDPLTGEFIFRLSLAEVVADGPFSEFKGYQRVLTLIDGKGMILRHDSGQVDKLTKRFDRARFSGDWKTTAALDDGPVRDFNVIVDQRYDVAVTSIKNGRFDVGEMAADDGPWFKGIPFALCVLAFDGEASISAMAGPNIRILKDHLLYSDQPQPFLAVTTTQAALVVAIGGNTQHLKIHGREDGQP